MVCFEHLRASDVANLCLHLLMLQGSLFHSKLLNFIMCGLMKALPKLLFRCCRPHVHYPVLIVLLLPLLRGFSPIYIIEHIPEYCSIEKFIKLPFQWVLVHLNRSPNEGAMAVLFLLLHAVQKISERATFGDSAISACRNLRLP